MNGRHLSPWRSLLLPLLGLMLLVGCAAPNLFSATVTAAPIQIVAPSDGQLLAVGHPVEITAIAEDRLGVAAVNFYVDEVLVGTTTPPFPQSYFVVVQRWIPDRATSYRIRAELISQQPGQSPAQATIAVLASTSVTPIPDTPTSTATPTSTGTVVPATFTPSPTPTITQTPTQTATPTPRSEPCVDQAEFVSDVTVPPGSTVGAGASFVKTWRVRNASDCFWDSNYSLVFVSDSRMGGDTVSLRTVEVGSTLDISVQLTAPSAPGAYVGRWRLQNPQGASFGPTLEVSITVPPACTNPTIHVFEANPATIAPGQASILRWDVSGATEIRLVPGGEGGVFARDELEVRLTQTTDYRLTATVGECSVEDTVRVTVQ
jgi:hypothetical protein